MPTEQDKPLHPVKAGAREKQWGPGKIIENFRERRLLGSVVEKDSLKRFCDDISKGYREQKKHNNEFESFFYTENMYALYSIYSVFALYRYVESPDPEHLAILDALDFGDHAIISDIENVQEYIESLVKQFGFSNAEMMRDALHSELNYLLTIKIPRKDGTRDDFDLFQERFNLPLADLAQR